MTLWALLLVLLQPPQEAFTRFTFCHDMPRGLYEKQCLYLNPEGQGEVRFKRRGSDEVDAKLTLTPSGRERFIAVIAATSNLANRRDYETKRRVADLGRKHLTLELPSGAREADYNYSDLKEVVALTSFFDGLLNQQTLVFDLESAVRFERLSVPERLEQLENELKSNRIGDPPGLIPVLEKIQQDSRVLDYAREFAGQLKDRLASGSVGSKDRK